ncbi:glycosyltransferase, group 2 family protein [delta proteobacterium NaphS2]|nr:glycosyltransferase, group 2 family protein [delta proteobacterium NaphS2]
MEKTFSRDRLIIFGRYPIPGNTKTRLIPVLGPVGAANLQRHLTEKTLDIATSFAAENNVTIECCFEGGSFQKIYRWLGPLPVLTFQRGGDLGRRMRDALFDALNGGRKRSVLLGTDIPGLTVEILKNAFDALLENDVVLGPSTDGGYWLIGMKRPIDLFQKIEWGSSRVLEQTLTQAKRLGLSCAVLKSLSDVDTPEDLIKWRPQKKSPEAFLTVVIPALNEEKYIGQAVSSAIAPDVEVIVADGGSKDRTFHRAKSLGASVIRTPPGRARQQNLGAAAATGENLLFLHADTLLPEGFAIQVFEILMSQMTVLGAFRFKTDFSHPLMHLVEWMTRLRSECLRLPYGDQALFMTKATFERIGGFPEVPIGEDLLLVRLLTTREKAQVVISGNAAITSGRRWERMGPFRTTWINQLILSGMALGINLKTLSRLYRKAF